MILEKSKIEKIIAGNFTEEELNELRIINRTAKFGFEYCDISKIQKKKGFIELMKYVRDKRAIRFSKEKRKLSDKLNRGDYVGEDERKKILNKLEKVTSKENDLLNSWASKFVRGQTTLTTDTMKANLNLLLSVGNIAATGIASVLICAVLKSVVNVVDSLVTGLTDDPEKFEDREDPKFDTFYRELATALRSSRGKVNTNISSVLYSYFRGLDADERYKAAFLLGYYRIIDKIAKPASGKPADISDKAQDIPDAISSHDGPVEVDAIKSQLGRVRDHDDLITVLRRWTGLSDREFSDLNVHIVETFIVDEGEIKALVKNMQMSLETL